MESSTRIAGRGKNAKSQPPRMLPQSKWTLSRGTERRNKFAASRKASRAKRDGRVLRESGLRGQIGHDPQTCRTEQIGYDSQTDGQEQIGYVSQNGPTGPNWLCFA